MWRCRFSKRDDAHAELKAAQEKGDQEAIEKFSKRTVKVTREHVDDVKKLLTLMGVPYVEVALVAGPALHCTMRYLEPACYHICLLYTSDAADD